MELSAKSRSNIEKLLLPTTFTVVTGHQPCLFTGPLYFIIKILQTIKLADTLNKQFPDNTIVPVYWMGAEDHDFEEINHFHLYRNTLTWESEEKGSVGRFKTEGLEKVFEELNEILGTSKEEDELRSLFKKAYLEHDTYGQATRFLVNALFADRGLVIVEGDRPAFKAVYKSSMKKELKEKWVYTTLNKSNEKLAEHGKIQVTPREINLFYTDASGRDRIIEEDGEFYFDSRPGRYRLEDLLTEMDKHPEHFSPNVLLRPLYQETILPNLAYIGGAGEMAYWLEIKPLFSEMNIPMPLLELRNSFIFIHQKQKDKLSELGLEVKDLFLEDHEWIAKLVEEQEDEIVSFEKERQQILDIMDDMKKIASGIDPTMQQVFEGEKVRMDKSLENLEKRVFKAQKLKSEVRINQVHKIKERVFPNGGLQERRENFAGFYAVEGKAFFDKVYEEIDPLEARMNIVVI
jgi:bacillithiol biosynthesis cysteine-adding enzyme BshC